MARGSAFASISSTHAVRHPKSGSHDAAFLVVGFITLNYAL
jgi:hypothetical protein